ncbi:hypothetical protein F5878DRAFT_300607 [Lentinula raphanica]|uniref:Uncharacterized protein n=1 Tax=Lentinula raphanica TaxID=153919 RepID=A0AA38P3I2_9AGAR|nr:hypothetical protein F5878DRAFT_300607 [Lentinula raphanica]
MLLLLPEFVNRLQTSICHSMMAVTKVYFGAELIHLLAIRFRAKSPHRRRRRPINDHRALRSDQFQLWFQNEKLPGFRLFLSAGNPCLVPDLPAKPAKRIFDLMFKKPSQSTQIDGVNELQGISVEFSDIDQRKAFLQQAFGVDKGDPKKPEAARGITYLDNVVNGPVVQYLHSRHKWGKNWVKKTLLSSWKEQMAKMLETVNKWGKERKQPQQPGAQQSQVLESTGSGSRQGSKSLGVNSTTPA